MKETPESPLMSKSCKFSVVMATYQGARWLPPQLASLLSQTRLPDEIVIHDDASDDGTWEQLQQFAQIAPCPVRLHRQSVNGGSTLNFASAIAAAQGDWIVLADQDDIWHPQKLTVLEQVATDQSESGVIFSDANLIDEQGQQLPYRLWECLQLSRRERQLLHRGQAFSALLRRNLVTGATLAFRQEYRALVLPIPACWMHDAWIALLVSAVAPITAVAEGLIDYRQHSGQQIGEPRRSWLEQARVAAVMKSPYFWKVAENFQLAHDRLAGRLAFSPSTENLLQLSQKAQHWRLRASLRSDRRRWKRVLQESVSGNYGRYSLGWKAVLQDLFL